MREELFSEIMSRPRSKPRVSDHLLGMAIVGIATLAAGCLLGYGLAVWWLT